MQRILGVLAAAKALGDARQEALGEGGGERGREGEEEFEVRAQRGE